MDAWFLVDDGRRVGGQILFKTEDSRRETVLAVGVLAWVQLTLTVSTGGWDWVTLH